MKNKQKQKVKYNSKSGEKKHMYTQRDQVDGISFLQVFLPIYLEKASRRNPLFQLDLFRALKLDGSECKYFLAKAPKRSTREQRQHLHGRCTGANCVRL